MKICDKCGAQNVDTAVFCSECGNVLAAADSNQSEQFQNNVKNETIDNEYGQQQSDVSEQPQNDVYGQPAGNEYNQPQNDVYGQPVNNGYNQSQNGVYTQPVNSYMEPPKKKNKGLIITLAIVISVLVIGICVIAGILFTKARKNVKDSNKKSSKKTEQKHHSKKDKDDDDDTDVEDTQVIFSYEDLTIIADFTDFDADKDKYIPIIVTNNTGKDLTVTDSDGDFTFYENVEADTSCESEISYTGQSDIEGAFWISDEHFDIDIYTTQFSMSDIDKSPSVSECSIDSSLSVGQEYLSKDVKIDKSSTNDNTTQANDTTQQTDAAQQNPPVTDTTNPQNDWKSMTVILDGRQLQMPFNYSDISDIFKIDLAEYGYDNGYVLNKGDKTYGIIDLNSDKYNCEFQVGFINTGENACDILQSQIWAFECDISSSNCTTYPSIVLPAGITWGSTVDQIKAAYGTDPDNLNSTYGDLATDGYTVLEYYNNATYTLKLKVDKDKGLTSIRYEKY